jgi:hypothetical protein
MADYRAPSFLAAIPKAFTTSELVAVVHEVISAAT